MGTAIANATGRICVAGLKALRPPLLFPHDIVRLCIAEPFDRTANIQSGLLRPTSAIGAVRERESIVGTWLVARCTLIMHGGLT